MSARNLKFCFSGAIAVSLLVAALALIAPSPIEAAAFFGHHSRDSGGCGRHEGRLEAHVAGWLDRELALDDGQRAAFDPVMEVAAAFHDRASALCDAEFDDARAGLVALADLSGDVQHTLGELIEAFDGFYATLDGDQQAKLDAALAWPHRHD